jgi:acetyltransferase-like isoleucine patch superfamily enzyme
VTIGDNSTIGAGSVVREVAAEVSADQGFAKDACDLRRGLVHVGYLALG